MQTNWVCRSEALRFCKNYSDSSLESLIVTRVESGHSVKNVTRVESSHRLSQRDSIGVRVTKNCDSSQSRVIYSIHAITGQWHPQCLLMSVVPVTFWPIWLWFRTAGNNFFTDQHWAATLYFPTPELHHCFSHSKKVRGLLEYVCTGLWEYVLIVKGLFLTSE